METNKLTKEELRQRLRSKISTMRTCNNKVQVNQKQYNQIMKQMNEELVKMKEDERITEKMQQLYQEVKETYKSIKVPTPKELLENMDLAKEKFKEYLTSLIDDCKKNGITPDKFKEHLNNKYTEYHIEVLGREIIPEKLLPLISIGKKYDEYECISNE